MTTLGKILVFCVFVAALGMGGLMLYVSKATPSWKEAVEKRDDEIKVFQTMLAQEAESRKKLLVENERMKQLLDNKIIEANGAMSKLKLEIDDKETQIKTTNLQRDKAIAQATQSQEEAGRLHKELEFTGTVVKAREAAILKLQDEIATAINAKQAAENVAQTAAARLDSLYKQLKEKDTFIAELTKKSQPAIAVGGGSGPRDASYSNPPPVAVKGQIERVDDVDKTLVKITIGSDAGLRKDQTLEVFRVSPKAEYLGRLVIVDADFRHAIGKLLRQPGMPVPALQAGDEVASKLR